MGRNSNDSLNNKTWKCASCEYQNANTKCCRMCGYELGNKVTRQNGGQSPKQNGHREKVGLQISGNNKPMVDVASANDLTNYSNPKSPSKHVDGNSDDGYDDIIGYPQSPPDDEPQNGAMMMVSREKKRESEPEEEQYESSSIEEQVGLEDPHKKKMVDANDANGNDNNMVPFDIPEVYPNENGAKAGKEQQQAQEPQKTPMQLLTEKYQSDEKAKKPANTKIKLKLRVGTVVDIYSSTRQDWTEGKIKEIKGDLICIVYGKHMKWLKKNSRQLRPKQQAVIKALEQQQQRPEPVAEDDILMNMAKKKEESPDAPPMAFGMSDPNDFQPPPPSGPPPANGPPPAYALNGDEMQAPLQPDHFNTPKNPRKQPQPNPAMMESKPDEFDYDVTFTTSVLGLELYPDRDGKNCIVGKCLSKTSKKFVDPSSIIVAVNDMWVAGMSYDMVRDAIKQAAKYPPLKIQFRVKMNNIGKKKNIGMNERGYLKVKVVAGVQLKHRASYCVVQVGNARLSTREVPRDEHPEWQEMLTFKNFRPDQGKKAIVTVYDHSTILKDKKIGTTSYEIPTQFNKLQRDTLELKSGRGKLSGVIILNTIIVHKSNSIRSFRKY